MAVSSKERYEQENINRKSLDNFSQRYQKIKLFSDSYLRIRKMSSISFANPFISPPDPLHTYPTSNRLPNTASTHINLTNVISVAPGTLSSQQLAGPIVIGPTYTGSTSITLPLASNILGCYPSIGQGDCMFIPVYNLSATGLTFNAAVGSAGSKTYQNYTGNAHATNYNALGENQGILLQFTNVAPVTLTGLYIPTTSTGAYVLY